MPLISEIGDTFETQGEVSIEWQIPDFFSLSEEVDNFYHSSVFSLSDSCWYLKIYPNGQTKYETPGMIGLYITRVDSGPPKTVSLKICIKEYDAYILTGNNLFTTGKGWGQKNFMPKSILLSRKSELMPSNILTITCNLKSYARHATKVSLFSRLWNVSCNLKAILDEGKKADYTFKSKGRDWPVHKMILESRCEYFAAMFRHDWLENTAGEVKFDDMEKGVLKNVLYFIYTGEVEKMTNQIVCNVYVAAHELLLKDLKVMCIEYMKENMCLELVCGALVIAEKYEEEELKECALKYFTLNSENIFAREEWKQFKEENSTLRLKLLENVIVEKVKQIKA